MNITIDNASPHFGFTGNWVTESQTGSNTSGRVYYRNTTHITSDAAASVTFAFNGSAAWIYGDLWTGAGGYSVRVDRGEAQSFNSLPGPRDDGASLLYSTGQLSNGLHQVTLINLPSLSSAPSGSSTSGNLSLALVFDYVVYQVPIPDGGSLTSTVIDDTSPAITYSRAWLPMPVIPQVGTFYNDTASQSAETNASLAFHCLARCHPTSANYSVSIDGRTWPELSACWFERKTQTPLFTVSGLAENTHQLNLINLARDSDHTSFEFDYAVANSTAGLTPTPTTGANPIHGGSTGTGSRSGVPVGGVVGGVVGGSILLALLGWILFCLRKRKRRRGGNDGTRRGTELRAIPPPMRIGSRAPGLSGREVRPFSPAPIAITSPTTTNGFVPARASPPATAAGLGHSRSNTLSSHVGSTYPPEKRVFTSFSEPTQASSSSSAYEPAFSYAAPSSTRLSTDMSVMVASPTRRHHHQPSIVPINEHADGQRSAEPAPPEYTERPVIPHRAGGEKQD